MTSIGESFKIKAFIENEFKLKVTSFIKFIVIGRLISKLMQVLSRPLHTDLDELWITKGENSNLSTRREETKSPARDPVSSKTLTLCPLRTIFVS
jgi:hypothetical protein